MTFRAVNPTSHGGGDSGGKWDTEIFTHFGTTREIWRSRASRSRDSATITRASSHDLSRLCFTACEQWIKDKHSIESLPQHLFSWYFCMKNFPFCTFPSVWEFLYSVSFSSLCRPNFKATLKSHLLAQILSGQEVKLGGWDRKVSFLAEW